VTGARSPSQEHRATTHPDAVRARVPREPPRLRTQALLAAAVPALVWTIAHPRLVLTALAVAALAWVAVALARRYGPRVRTPAPLAE